MAEIQSNKHTVKGESTSLHKKNTRVDLTPMVDLGFLLITFFVFTTTMSRPTAMNLVIPNDTNDTVRNPVCNSCVLTTILTANNKIKYYEGDIATALIKETDYSSEGIRKILVEKKKKVQSVRGKSDAFVLVIKPSKEATFKNFVDMTDEVAINNIKQYYIDEIRGDETKVL
ncbi:biopolymer transporter ExbD [Ferruginibacter lapsinanis]|uniref:ExbD/TolR family protein n=1 Tax=Ferruginibacter lapsinanis TaxID=563172 RepID=UPI001E3F41F9|nr:biopolymer transporter ExbD [Ferruginibacter lapsinanis]UEG49999.1 biopolymer transporter ExbD [Ferruginibacter lapsinanis]